MRSLIPAFAAVMLAGSAAPALAETAPSVLVSYDDLNLGTPEGRQELETRIARAVNKVCERPHRSSAWEGQVWADCRDLSTAKALEQVNHAVAAAQTTQVASAD